MILFFSHIPKTGGQTLMRAFREVFGSKCIHVYDGGFANTISVKDFMRRDLRACRRKWFARRPLQKVLPVLGHLTIRDFLKNEDARAECLQGGVRFLSVVRDPVERLVSAYNYIRYNPEHPDHESVLEMTLEDFLSKADPNTQLEYLKFSEEDGVDEVCRKVEIFPLKYSVGAFNEAFIRHVGVGFGELEIRNSSRGRAAGRPIARVGDISADLLDHLEQKHSCDRRLYEKASHELQPGNEAAS